MCVSAGKVLPVALISTCSAALQVWRPAMLCLLCCCSLGSACIAVDMQLAVNVLVFVQCADMQSSRCMHGHLALSTMWLM
jgi:hypothetical protein